MSLAKEFLRRRKRGRGAPQLYSRPAHRHLGEDSRGRVARVHWPVSLCARTGCCDFHENPSPLTYCSLREGHDSRRVLIWAVHGHAR